MPETFGIYIHVPFCRSRCRYCDFYSTLDETMISRWLDGVLGEMALTPAPEFLAVDTVYFGGGTPSLLGSRDVERLLGAVDLHYGMGSDAEITLEANPGTISSGQLKHLRAMGVNRLNFGFQSLDDRVLAFLGRGHSAAEAKKAWEMARKAGFSNMGLDLIYGLPGQGIGEWERELEKGLSFEPEHLSLYMLSIEAETPMGRDLAAGRMRAPDEGQVADLLRFTLNFMDDQGFPWYEVSNFAAAPMYQSRHNRGYWEKKPYMGFGPAAHSWLPPVRRSNVPDLRLYADLLREGKVPLDMEEVLDSEAMRMESFYLGFRTRKGLDVAAFEGTFGGDFFKDYRSVLDTFERKGFIEHGGGFCRLTVAGMIFLDAITSAFCCHETD
ncbi:oxygen-independent coproporphyrinogen-3 oxidase [Desulfobotulus alkaliphilus]|uniref:Heme chaperone HemW n=1 Tax=Desulfobotulus alkaliphilus TaxID=622671 RepID=A0A562R542_9BACT|nr:radical SAM family heme chaperone HemW [Desulfobotulus alkaliphilus]TWI64177.1 oxygen-independent coproporphyrinogen-3 oxidase [Desulfobotulus alkaliphilus]